MYHSGPIVAQIVGILNGDRARHLDHNRILSQQSISRVRDERINTYMQCQSDRDDRIRFASHHGPDRGNPVPTYLSVSEGETGSWQIVSSEIEQHPSATHCSRTYMYRPAPLRMKNSEYDQEIPQSQTADKPMTPRGMPHSNHETPGRQTKKSNQLSLPHQYDCKTRMDIK